MSLSREKQPFAEPPGQIGLERADLRLIDAFVMRSARRESFDFAGVAGRSDYKRPVARDTGNALRPPIDRLRAKRDNFGRRTFAFASRRQHAARAPRTGGFAKMRRAFEDFDLRAAFGKFKRRRKTNDARADDSNAHLPYSAAGT